MRIFCFIVLSVCLFTNFNLAISQTQLDGKTKTKIRKELKKMVELDQQYRKVIATHPANSDDLWVKQSVNDSINKIHFIEIILKHGYPSKERIGSEFSVLITLHLTNEIDFIELDTLFRKELHKSNLSATEYARWYDRCQINMKKSTFYGVYGKKEFCGEELLLVNRHRKDIGLNLLEEKCQ